MGGGGGGRERKKDRKKVGRENERKRGSEEGKKMDNRTLEVNGRECRQQSDHPQPVDC